MRRVAVGVLLSCGILLVPALALASGAEERAAPATPVRATIEAQHAPAPVVAASPTGGRGGDGRPWGRLIVFVPLAIALGAGTTALARLLRSRGIVRD